MVIMNSISNYVNNHKYKMVKLKKIILKINFSYYLKKILNFVEKFFISILLIHISPIPAKKFIIITGSNSLYFNNLKKLLKSIRFNEKNTKIIVFDLGLKKNEVKELKNKFKKIDLRKFNFSKYPKYFNININAGEYAWKPIIISNILEEFKCSVFWMDASNIVLKELNIIKKIMRLKGFYSPYSDGEIKKWTHHKTVKFLKASSKILKKKNLSGGSVAVNYEFNNIRSLMNKWKKCALKKNCIAPKGSSRKNHRQDQAVLSILAHQSNVVSRLFNGFYSFEIHQNRNEIK